MTNNELFAAITTELQNLGHKATWHSIYNDGESDKSAYIWFGDASNYETPTAWVSIKDGRVAISRTYNLVFLGEDGRVKHANCRFDRTDDSCNIGVSATKTPKQIAADINRRFIPDFMRLHAVSLDRLRADLAYADKRLTGMKLIGIADRFESERHTLMYGGCGNISVSTRNCYGDYCCLDISGVPYEKVAAILEVLK